MEIDKCKSICHVWSYHEFTEQIIPVWNQLAAETADFASLKKFKAFLNVADMSTYITAHF
jgi:hypothetical protein